MTDDTTTDQQRLEQLDQAILRKRNDIAQARKLRDFLSVNQLTRDLQRLEFRRLQLERRLNR